MRFIATSLLAASLFAADAPKSTPAERLATAQKATQEAINKFNGAQQKISIQQALINKAVEMIADAKGQQAAAQSEANAAQQEWRAADAAMKAAQKEIEKSKPAAEKPAAEKGGT